jgi:hypothetical protein
MDNLLDGAAEANEERLGAVRHQASENIQNL